MLKHQQSFLGNICVLFANVKTKFSSIICRYSSTIYQHWIWWQLDWTWILKMIDHRLDLLLSFEFGLFFFWRCVFFIHSNSYVIFWYPARWPKALWSTRHFYVQFPWPPASPWLIYTLKWKYIIYYNNSLISRITPETTAFNRKGKDSQWFDW